MSLAVDNPILNIHTGRKNSSRTVVKAVNYHDHGGFDTVGAKKRMCHRDPRS